MIPEPSNLFELIQNYKCNKFFEYIRIAKREIKMYIQKLAKIYESAYEDVERAPNV